MRLSKLWDAIRLADIGGKHVVWVVVLPVRIRPWC